MGAAAPRSGYGDAQGDDVSQDDLLNSFLDRFGSEMDVAPCMSHVLHSDVRAAEGHKQMYQNHMLMGLTAAWAAKTVGYSGVISEQREIAAHLVSLHREEVEFGQVEIYREPLDSGVADHHVLVYWYESPQNMGTAGFRLDWGVNGLFHRDCLDMPQESLLVSKECGLRPRTLMEQLLRLRGKEYSVVHFNCQHFCKLLMGQAGGNARLGNALLRLDKAGALLTSAALYWSQERWTMVYWHQDPCSSTDRGFQIKWSDEGLSFLIVWSEPEAICVRRRGCAMRPSVLRQQLRKVEGRSYQADEWNDWHLMQWLFGQVLAKGRISALHKRLEELAEQSVEIAGVIEAIVDVMPGESAGHESAAGQHALVYTYRPGDRPAVHLWLTFNSEGISFSEAEEEPEDASVLRLKPMMFECLQPHVLQQQLLAIEDCAFDLDTWSSRQFCEQLFAEVPGRALPGQAAFARSIPVPTAASPPELARKKHPDQTACHYKRFQMLIEESSVPFEAVGEQSAKLSETCNQLEGTMSELKRDSNELQAKSWRGKVRDGLEASSASSIGMHASGAQQTSGSEEVLRIDAGVAPESFPSQRAAEPVFETEPVNGSLSLEKLDALDSDQDDAERAARWLHAFIEAHAVEAHRDAFEEDASESEQRSLDENMWESAPTPKVAKPGRELNTLWEALKAHRAAAGEGSTISSSNPSPRSVATISPRSVAKAE
mmetsp:Transcript_76154/g.143529  ORF Transcript_76154/g.143529 Transcript_76154/m.143529 type:complete len:714 (+) Transcript_76154:124-2265(+)